MQHIKYSKIPQFRNCIKDLQMKYKYEWEDEKGYPIYIEKDLPTITFTGTVKLHGTNMSVGYNGNDFWVQSRNQIVESDKESMGFYNFAMDRKQEFIKYLSQFSGTVIMYGEWAGKGIQKGVAIQEIEKSFFVFGLRKEKEEKFSWVKYNFKCDRVYNIQDFKTYSIDIDLNNPKLVQNKLKELTEEVEKECPVAKTFGFSGIGEGIVWTYQKDENEFKFKTKGQKHSVTRVVTIANVDIEVLKNMQEFTEYSVTENRVQQAIQEVGSERKNIGEIIKDIFEEEKDTIEKNKISTKEVGKYLAKKIKSILFTLM